MMFISFESVRPTAELSALRFELNYVVLRWPLRFSFVLWFFVFLDVV